MGFAAHHLPVLLGVVHSRKRRVRHWRVEEAAKRRPAFSDVEHQQPLRWDGGATSSVRRRYAASTPSRSVGAQPNVWTWINSMPTFSKVPMCGVSGT